MKKLAIARISAQIAAPLEAIASSPRIAILLTIGRGEACVCHLESALGWRQAYISQHLMALRRAGILTDRREGRYIFYRLTAPAFLELITAAAALSGLRIGEISALIEEGSQPACGCPQCSPALIQLNSPKSA
jgi:ArsR family transcriptional regulator